jgi:hexosaminidase
MGWEEIMTENMSKDAIIHAWGTNEGQEAGGALIKAAKADTILFCQMAFISIWC